MIEKRHLFLDLEDTVITPVVNGWHNFELINVELIRKIIEKHDPHEVHVFSFAIWDDHQRELFNQHTRHHIERALGVPFTMIPTVEEIIVKCSEAKNIHPSKVDFSDAVDFWGKGGSFRLFCEALWKDNQSPVNVLLLDDAVTDEFFKLPVQKVEANIVNIEKISWDAL